MRVGVVAAAGVLVLAGAGVAGGVAAISAAAQQTASCTPSPVVSTPSTGNQRITVVCTVPNPPATTVTAPGPTATVTVTATPSPTPTAPTTTAPPPPPAAAVTAELALPRVAWDGGPSYFAKFPKASAAGWTDPSFFPVGVFLGKPEHATSLKQLGINFYMGAEHDGSTMASITSQGMFVLPQQDEWTKTEVGDNPQVPGWFISDECEMGLGGCNDASENTQLASQQQYVTKVRGYADGRFAQANFGNGIVHTFWSPNTMDDHVALMDVVSADKYSYTSPPVDDLLKSSPDWPTGANPATAASYGWQADQMRRFMAPDALKPTWVFVETKRPFLSESDARSITPDQLEGAVWSGLIHEARGVAFFQHNNDPSCGVYSLVECGTVLRSKVTALTAEIRNVAPVLNTQSYKYGFGAAGIDTMLKTYQGDAYVFADVGLGGTTGAKTFTLPTGVTGTTVTVVGEGRALPVTGGKFTDSFAAEYTHHVYRIGL